MAFFIGGDTSTLEYDFGLKVANSVAECPLKIYKQEVDTAALPNPTTGWTEVTSQSVLDKLKTQNELPVTAIASDLSNVTWNGKTLPKTATIKVLDDFAGKAAGSTVANPHISKFVYDNAIKSPSDTLGWVEASYGCSYPNFSALSDEQKASVSQSNAGNISQQLFSFNLIEMVERKYGAIPSETTAGKVAWLKSNLSKTECNWYGYGSCPTGNKANLTQWAVDANNWGSVYSNTASSPTNLQIIQNASLPNKIDANGFMYILAYTDASNGTIASAIYTDYISLELTLKAPETLITATNALSDIVTDFAGKVNASTAANANLMYASGTPQNPQTVLATPTVLSAFTAYEGYDYDGGIGTAYSKISTLNGTTARETTITNAQIPQQLFSFNIIAAVEKQLGQPIPSIDKVQWCKDNVNYIGCDWYGFGSCPSGNKAIFTQWRSWINSWDSPLRTIVSATPSLASVDTKSSTGVLGNMIDSNGFTHYLAYTDPSDGVTASTIYTDYVKLTIKLKYIPTYDFYTDSNTRRDAGLTDIILVKRKISDMTSDFVGKVAGSVVENANKAYSYKVGPTLLAPTGAWTGELSYAGIMSLSDASTTGTTATTSGNIPQQLFQFNLIAIAEKTLGTSIQGADTAAKVQWLKDNLSNIKCDWYGYGTCPSGYKANFAYYRYGTTWQMQNNTANSITLMSWSALTNISEVIDVTGFANFLAYTDASDGVTPSVINTDYVKLTLTFKTDTVGYEFFTNNSVEVSVTTVNKASALLVECDLTNIATAQYGGSNAALKAAFKSLSVDTWCKGSGVNASVLTNGVKMYWWSGSAWLDWFNANSTANIDKIGGTVPGIAYNYLINSSNKFYIIVNSQYKSDGSIASEVNLDYLNIKIGLARIPDVVAPISVNLPKYWAMVVRGLSHSFDGTTSYEKYIFTLYKDATNYVILRRFNSGILALGQVINNNYIGLITAKILEKYKCNSIIVQQTTSSLVLWLLKNNDVVEKVSVPITSPLYGLCQIYLNQSRAGNQADAFVNSFHLIDLERIGRSAGLTDAEATSILKGTLPNLLGLTNPELFDINKVTLHDNATRSGNTITLNATAAWQTSSIDIPVLPNNRYEAKADKIGNGAYVYALYYYNNILLDSTAQQIVQTSSADGALVKTLNTPNNCNKIKMYVSNDKAGTFTFSNISLKRLD
jgi:hypothetical protein